MHCKFCPTNPLAKDKDSYNYLKCYRCGSMFYFREDNTITCWRFFKKYKGHNIEIEWAIIRNKTIIYDMQSHEILYACDGELNINPHNVATRLPIIITFR